MVELYCACDFDEQPAQFLFDRVKTDQDLPVYVIIQINGL